MLNRGCCGRTRQLSSFSVLPLGGKTPPSERYSCQNIHFDTSDFFSVSLTLPCASHWSRLSVNTSMLLVCQRQVGTTTTTPPPQNYFVTVISEQRVLIRKFECTMEAVKAENCFPLLRTPKLCLESEKKEGERREKKSKVLRSNLLHNAHTVTK